MIKMDKKEKLDLISEKIKICQKCLAFDKTNPAAGYGNINSKIVLIGEAEGKEELAQGKPFVGKSGQLLTDILKSVGIDREYIYITNTCKCHPPNNRKPTEEECKNCKPYLDLQLKVINPKYIFCMGATAAQSLLETETPISYLRGKWHNFRGHKVLPSFHPAYLCRNTSAKEGFVKDLQILVEDMNVA
jgi:uracil-DNA glycosylase family 4